MKKTRYLLLTAFLLASLFITASPARPAYAAALTVTNTNDSGAGSLRQAITDAYPGDTIEFAADLSGGTITLGSQLTIDKDLTIDGSSLASHVTISGADQVRVFYINAGVTAELQGLDILNGIDSSTSLRGGGIRNDGTLTVTNSTISGNGVKIPPFNYPYNYIFLGGGIYNQGTLTVRGSTFSDNSANYGGGIWNDGTLTVTDSTFSGNSADSGGGFQNYGTLTVTSSTFSGNSAVSGGGIWNDGTLNLVNTILANSTAGGDCVNNGTMGTDVNNLIETNTVCGTPVSTADPLLGPLQDNGGPTHTMAIDPTSPAFDSGDNNACPATDQRGVARPQGGACDIGAFEAIAIMTVNSLNDPGIGICDAADCTLREAIAALDAGGTIDFAAPLSGGTITLSSQLTIDKDLTIDGSSLASHITISGAFKGRVFYVNPNVTAALQGLEIIYGVNSLGGGIFNEGTLAVIDSTFSGNSANYGGGILNLGTLTVTDSTFSGNSASDGDGGGILNGGMLMATNSTFSGNHADYGGGIWNNYGTLTATNSTFSGNHAYYSGGGISNRGTLNLANTILANSTSGGDCVNDGTMDMDSHNLIVNNSGCGTPISTADPLLGPLQDNGGPTHTMAIDRTSPAFDSGDNDACPATDQRGVTRPQGDACDIGAYEVTPLIYLSPAAVAENRADTYIGDLFIDGAPTGVTYSFVLSEGSDSFSIDGESLYTVVAFNYEAQAEYKIRIRADDGDPTTNDFENPILIEILDANDAPQLEINHGMTAKKGEGTPILNADLLATDEDGDTPVYSLVDTPVNGALQLDNQNLVSESTFTQQDIDNRLLIYAHDDSDPQQDYPQNDSFSFTVRDDKGDEIPTFQITIIAGNLPPIAQDDGGFETHEDTELTIPISELLDNDYDLESDPGIVGVDGENIVYTPAENYHGEDSFLYTITDGEYFSTATVFISVNPVNDQPTEITLDKNSLDENEDSLTVIGRFATTDVDEGDSFTYSFATGDGYDNASFRLYGDKLYSAASFDYEGKSSYQIHVNTTDSMGATIPEAFSILIEDVNENPTMISLNNTSVVENSDPVPVGDLSAEDPDGDSITFSLVEGSGSYDNQFFSIQGNSLSAPDGLDYEEKTTRSIRVRADDGNRGSLEKVLLINVIDIADGLPGVTNCESLSGDTLTLFSSLENRVEIELTEDPEYTNNNDRVCNLKGKMRISVPGNESVLNFSGWVNERNHILSETIGDLSLNLAGLTLHARNVSIEYYAESPFLRINNPEIKIPDAWGGLGSTVPNPTIIDGGGLRIGTPEIPEFALPTIKSSSGFELALNGQLIPDVGGYKIEANGEFTIPKVGKKTSTGGKPQECSIGVGVTIFSGSQGSTSMTLVSLDAVEASTADNSVALWGMSVDMSCTPRGIPIGTTGFGLTGVSGGVDLTPTNEFVSLGVTISSIKKFPTKDSPAIIEVDGETEVKLNPFELDLTVTLKVLIFEMAEASATIKENSFNATLHIDILVATGDVTVNAWSQQDDFHFTGTGVVTVGVPKYKWGQVCLWYPCGVKMCKTFLGSVPCGAISCSTCTGLPPVNLELASTGCQFGEFTNGAYGFKGFASYKGISYGYYVDHTGKLSYGNVDRYQLMQNPYSSSSLLEQGYSPQVLTLTDDSSTESDQILTTTEGDVYTTTISQGDVSFVVVSNQPLTVTLKDPDGAPITPTSNLDHVKYEQSAHYELEQVMTCDEQELSCEFEEQPGYGEDFPRLRFVFASPNPALDQVNVKIDGTIIFEQVWFTDTVHQDYISINPGEHTITIESLNQPISKTITFEAIPDTDYTVATLEDESWFATVLTDTNIMPEEPGTARVRVVNGSEDDVPVDVLIGDSQAEVCSPTTESTPVKCIYLAVPAGDHIFEIRVADSETKLTVPRTINLVEGMVYSIYIADIQIGEYLLDWMQTLDESYTRVYHTAYNVDQAEAGAWQVILKDVPDTARYEVLMQHAAKPPVFEGLTMQTSADGEVTVEWQLTTEISPTLVTIYATQGPVTQAMIVSATQTTTETITLPKFEGVPVYDENITFEPGEGMISRIHSVDLSQLESGDYYLWITADDSVNPPISGYFVSPEYADNSVVEVAREGYDPLAQLEHSIDVEVDQSDSFPNNWTTFITPTVDLERHEIHIDWDLLEHPDVDTYHVIVESPDLATKVITSTSVINEYDEIDESAFHTVGYAKVESIEPGQTYTLTIEARDLDSDRSVRSIKVGVDIQTGNFELSADNEIYKVEPGDEITIPIRLVGADDLYYPFVNLGVDVESAPLGVRAQFADDYLGVTTLSAEDNEVDLHVSIAESTPPRNLVISIYGYNGDIKKSLNITLQMNNPPDAEGDTYYTDENKPLSVAQEEGLLSNDTDLDGDELSVIAVDTDTSGTHGSVDWNDDGSFSYDPNEQFEDLGTDETATDSFTYTVTDPSTDTDSATVTIHIIGVNDAPVAENDTYQVNEDALLEINDPGVLENDSDVEGGILAVELVSDAEHGSVTLNENGSFTYMPEENFNGSDSFTYKICDLDSLCDNATVKIDVNPVNDDPVANDDTAATDEDVAVIIPVLDNDSDVDGDLLTISEVSAPPNGTVTVNPDGTVTYTPGQDYFGEDSFTYTICDQSDACDPATVTVTIGALNDAPVANDDSSSTPEDTAVVVDAAANDSDVDGNLDPTSAVLFESPLNGIVTNNGEGIFAYTPNENFNGSDSFTYTICDTGQDGDSTTEADDLCDSAGVNVQIQPVNDVPVAMDDTAATDEDTAVNINAAANDSDVDGNLDPTSAVLFEGPSNGALSNNGDGTFTYTPYENFNGSDSFTYTICDTGQDGGSTTDTDDLCDSAVVYIQVYLVNDAPVVVTSPQSQEVQYSDGILPVIISAEDVDSSPLTLEMDLPGWLELSGDCTTEAKGSICTWILAGVPDVAADKFDFGYTVDDGDGGQVSAAVSISVNPENSNAVFHSGNPVAVRVVEDGGDSGLFELEVRVWETYPDHAPDGTIAQPGDISLAQVSMTLKPVGPGGEVSGGCSVVGVYDTGYDAFQRVVCSFDAVPVNTYLVTVNIDSGYYAGVGEDVLVVYDPSLGFTTAGGSFYWPETAAPENDYPGDKTSFGYTMKYNKTGTNVKGSLLLIRHLKDGSTYQVKSNALYGLSLGVQVEGDETFGWASFSGKATYLEPGWPEAIGNYEFLVYVEDRNKPDTGIDRFWVEVKDKAREVVTVMSIPREATENAQDLDEGEVYVPH